MNLLFIYFMDFINSIDPDFEAELERESAELERSSSGNKIDQQLSTEDLGKVPFPSNEGVIEIPIIEEYLFLFFILYST